MKSLDEVIKACEETVHYLYDHNVSIDGCYLGAEETIDALHYLKEYQKILPLIPSLINTAIAVQKKGKTIG